MLNRQFFCLWSTVQAKELDGSKDRPRMYLIDLNFKPFFQKFVVFVTARPTFRFFRGWFRQVGSSSKFDLPRKCNPPSDQPMRNLSDSMTSISFELIGWGCEISKWPKLWILFFEAIKERVEVEAEILLQRPQWSGKYLKMSLEASIEVTESFKNFYVSKPMILTKIYFHFWQLSEKH